MTRPKRSRHTEASGSQPQSPPVSSPEYDSTEEAVGYDPEKFTSQSAFDEYKRLMGKTVIKERGFIPVTTDGNLVSMVENLGWVAVCESPPPVPLAVVREFYANAKALMNGSVLVRGVTVDYSPEAIRGLLELPVKPDGVDDWAQKSRADVDLDILIAEICVPGTAWTRTRNGAEYVSFPATALNRYARAWNYFLCSNLSPNLHSNVVTVERAILLYAILNEQYIDLGWLMYQNMRRFMRAATSGAIPHGSVVSRLCSQAGVRWGPEEPLQQPMGDVDSGLISRLVEWPGGTPHRSGLGYIVGDEPAQRGRGRGPRAVVRGRGRGDGAGTSRGARAGTSQASGSGITASEYRRLIRRIDASHEINRRMFADMQQVLDEMYVEHGIQQPTWPVFGAHTAYPPPDSPPEEGDDDE